MVSPEVYTHLVEGSLLLGVLGLVWKVSADSGKKVDTIFRRFDDYKASVKNDFVNKDVCNERVVNLSRDVAEIKADVKILIRNGNHK